MSLTLARRCLVSAALAALIAFPLISNSLYYQNLLILTFVLAIGASGWNIMGGYAGYISLGNSAFIGLGAYTTGILAAKQQLSPFIGCLIGGGVCAVAAAVLSLVTRRTRGMYFVIVTFATLQLLGVVATTWSGLTGGSQGLALPLPTWSLSYQTWPIYFPLLALLVLTVAASILVRRSKLGAGLFAIQDDEDKAAGLGLRTAVYKMIAFVLGGTFVGIAGGLYAYYVTFLNVPAVFDIVTSVLIVLSTLLGGRGTIWGPVVGAFIVEPLADLTSTNLGGADSGAIRLLLFGGLLGAVVLFLPRGVLPTLTERWRRSGPKRSRPSEAAGSPPAPTGRTSAPNSAALELQGVSKAFGGIQAVDSVSLRVEPGCITGLIGPNGSGKTTLFNLIDGTVPTRSGRISVGGRRLDRDGRPGRAHAGLARTYQLPRLFPSLTVLENLVLAEPALSPRRLVLRRVTEAERTRAMTVLEDLGLAEFADTSPGELSYGQRKLVELAQVIWLEPVVVLLDEPAAGISPALSQRLAETVLTLRGRGVGILLVEHNLPFLASLCERVYVMSNGAVIAEGTVAEVSAERSVVDAYLGDEIALVPKEINA
ncbi:branched-chain amino acid ABC transporter ATP-binding protein/permease [Jatrophihabitans telluris]|uniref:Branched-chain amino acid ABC transporter ATP-binding protein/permease n=1 Tax=Jatrophihabitans telluris TaxID=2038343 RepID=A0ABY4QUI0_9ACTN|nr:branched-chain amino acid ABC transporter ATP-binding protein/permease [Jatrophihabitans telluris]UQX86953.1 branched-chain amino acid ABC transporter ATP-binding protein/permease [Jatrophihabitans telluris]